MPASLWATTCGAVLNEVKRVLIVFSQLFIDSTLSPMANNSRS
jgi:hypothetical protein